MNFLDEAVYNVKKGNMPPDPATLDKDDIVNIGEKKLDPVGQEDDDINNDGKVNSTDKYLANKRKAIAKAILKSKKTIKKEDLEEGKLANALGGAAMLASLLLIGRVNSNDKVVQRLKAEYEQAEPAQKDSIQKLLTKRLIFLDSGEFDDSTPMNEDLKKFLRGGKYETPASDFLKSIKDFGDLDGDGEADVKDSDKAAGVLAKIFSGEATQAEFDAYIKALEKKGTDSQQLTNIEDIYKDAKSKRDMNEDKEEKFDYKAPKDKDKDDIRIDPDTKFQVDLKHLIQKHMKEGKSREDVIKITKKLMAKLHNKGKVEIDGTTLLFKEADLDVRDMQMSLPQPDAPDYLGDDGMDYEGGMAKSQMLKMKKYAVALCDMIEDESQLESWVQAKLTKASDYMSSVFHYLDYQRSKMNEAMIGGKKVDPKSLEGEDNMFTYAEFMDGTKLTDDELDQLTDDDDMLYSYFGPGGVGHQPKSDFM